MTQGHPTEIVVAGRWDDVPELLTGRADTVRRLCVRCAHACALSPLAAPLLARGAEVVCTPCYWGADPDPDEAYDIVPGVREQLAELLTDHDPKVVSAAVDQVLTDLIRRRSAREN